MAFGIHWGSIASLLLLALAVMGSPGPATMALVAAGSAYGVRRTAPYLAGVVAGTALVLIAVACGITAALLSIPAAGSALVWLSAAYILWLAFRIATATPGGEAKPASTFSWTAGVVIGVGNPKAWIAIGAVFASTRLADMEMMDAVAKTAVLALMIVVICTAWLLAGTAVMPLLRQPRRARLVNVALAVALVTATALAVLH